MIRFVGEGEDPNREGIPFAISSVRCLQNLVCLRRRIPTRPSGKGPSVRSTSMEGVPRIGPFCCWPDAFDGQSGIAPQPIGFAGSRQSAALGDDRREVAGARHPIGRRESGADRHLDRSLLRHGQLEPHRVRGAVVRHPCDLHLPAEDDRLPALHSRGEAVETDFPGRSGVQ